MTNHDKKQLVELLTTYMGELAHKDSENLLKQRQGKSLYECKSGVKAQYDHARLIVSKLMVEISKEMWAI